MNGAAWVFFPFAHDGAAREQGTSNEKKGRDAASTASRPFGKESRAKGCGPPSPLASPGQSFRPVPPGTAGKTNGKFPTRIWRVHISNAW